MTAARKSLSDLPETRERIFQVHLHFLGLTEADKEALDVDDLFKCLYKVSLETSIHKELEKMRLKISLGELSRQLAQQCIVFAKSQTSDEINHFFQTKLIKKEALKQNILGAVELIKRYQRNAENYLSDKPEALRQRSSDAFKQLIKDANNQQSYVESIMRIDIGKLSSRMLVIPLAFILLYESYKLMTDDKNLQKRVSFTLFVAFLMIISLKIAKVKPLSSAQVQLSANMKTLSQGLLKISEEFLQVYFEHRKPRELEEKKLTPGVMTVIQKFSYDASSPKPAKTSEDKSAPTPTLVKTLSPDAKDEMKFTDNEGNTYIRIEQAKNPHTFFKFNAKKIHALVLHVNKSNPEDITQNFKDALLVGRLNKGRGFKFLGGEERTKTGWHSKVRIKRNEQLFNYAPRQPKTEFETEKGMKCVIEPAKVELHEKQKKNL